MKRLLLGVVLLAGCFCGCGGLPADVAQEVRRARDGARAVANDASSSQREAETALACHDVLWAVLFATGDEDQVPGDVQTRRAQRAAAAAAASAAGQGSR